MKEMYFTIAGCNHYFGSDFMEKGMKVKLVKEPDNEYDTFVDVGEAHALGFAELYGLDFHHKINHSLLLYSTGCRIRGSNLSRHT